MKALMHYIDTACIVRRAGHMKRSRVRPSVCPGYRPQLRAGFAAERPSSMTINSKCEQCHIDSWCRKLKLVLSDMLTVLRSVHFSSRVTTHQALWNSMTFSWTLHVTHDCAASTRTFTKNVQNDLISRKKSFIAVIKRPQQSSPLLALSLGYLSV